MPSPLPEFECPPLDEVVIGVQFAPLAGFEAAHLGLFWSTIREQYPITESQVPLTPDLEQPEPRPVPRPENVKINFSPIRPVPRCWFLDQPKNNVIQLQRDRFHRNWRRSSGDEPYPRFGTLIGEFRRDWQRFLSFVQREGLGGVSIIQCELTYINQIEQGSGWTNFGELDQVFSVVRPSAPGSFLPPPEVFGWEAKYKLPDGKGRLSVEAGPAFRGRDLKMILSLGLTARGAPASSSEDHVFAWFDLAHEWVVRAFHQLTAPAAHQLWEERS